ncbi:PH domain-containing protein [Streptomyces hebeiensis]
MTREPSGPPGNRFDRPAVGWWRARLALLFAAAIAILVLHAVVPGLFKLGGHWLFVPAAAVAVLAVPTVLLLPAWWFEAHRWEVTDVAVHVRTGYFWQRSKMAPLSRIQSVDTVRGPLRKRFGLATVTVTTAAVKGSLRIEGLREERATAVADEITRASGAGS